MKEYKVGDNMVVSYAYRLSDESDGKLLFMTPTDAPDTFLFGRTPQIVPGLEAQMKGLKAGDRFEVVLPPQAAFGEFSKENILELDRSVFTRDGKFSDEVKVGAELPMLTQEGYRVVGRVMEITPDKVKMDFNHPFAGKTVKWEGEIVDVRPATDEELAMMKKGGCCGGCSGSGCSDGDCGSGCGGCH